MINWDNFNWCEQDKTFLFKEATNKIYEKYFQVEEGDLVVDIGSFLGTFTYSILDQKPSHCFCIEPVYMKELMSNLKGYPVSFLKGAISNDNEVEIEWAGKTTKCDGIKFNKFIADYHLDKIDFLKIDCEGGEYLIFTEDNIDYLKNNVRKIAMEFHLESEEHLKLFINFRDNILPFFPNFEVGAVNGVKIKWDLYNDHFTEYYNQVIFYFDNR